MGRSVVAIKKELRNWLPISRQGGGGGGGEGGGES